MLYYDGKTKSSSDVKTITNLLMCNIFSKKVLIVFRIENVGQYIRCMIIYEISVTAIMYSSHENKKIGNENKRC